MAREHRYFVYILSSKSRRIYTEVTGDLYRRVMQHKRDEIEGFTQHYKREKILHGKTWLMIGESLGLLSLHLLVDKKQVLRCAQNDRS